MSSRPHGLCGARHCHAPFINTLQSCADMHAARSISAILGLLPAQLPSKILNEPLMNISTGVRVECQ